MFTTSIGVKSWCFVGGVFRAKILFYRRKSFKFAVSLCRFLHKWVDLCRNKKVKTCTKGVFCTGFDLIEDFFRVCFTVSFLYITSI